MESVIEPNRDKCASREAKYAPTRPQSHKRKVNLKKTVKIGRPGYRVIFDPDTKQRSMFFQVCYTRVTRIKETANFQKNKNGEHNESTSGHQNLVDE